MTETTPDPNQPLDLPPFRDPEAFPPEKEPLPEDPRDFYPDEHEFPEDPELNPGLEYKLDVIIKYLDDILDTLDDGFGCLIPLMLGILALLGLIAGLLSAIHALLTWIFAYIAFWTVQLLVKRIIHGRPWRPRMWAVPIIWLIVGGVFALIFFGVPYAFGWWVPGGRVAPTPTRTATPTPAALLASPTPVAQVLPPATATPSPTPTPATMVSEDATEDTFDRNTGSPYVNPQADITAITVTRTPDGYEVRVRTRMPFGMEDYSFAILLTLIDCQGNPRSFIYQVHAGEPLVGEVDSNTMAPVPGSPATVMYDFETGEMTVFLPDAWFNGLCPPFTAFVETFHMPTPNSTWSGDEHEGPLEFPGLSASETGGEAGETGQATLLLSSPAFCRAGPGIEYEQEWNFEAGMSLPIVARYPNGWWLVGVDDPRTRTECCWVGPAAGSPQGDISRVPVLSQDQIPPGGTCP